MKIFLLIICFILLDIFFIQITKVTFDNYRAKVSSLYCRLAGLDNLPKDPVIFVPGIKGSTLEDKNGNELWLTLTGGLLNQPPLKYSEGDGIKATGIFTGFSFVPYLLQYKAYYTITADLACAPNAYFFYYDWRDYPDNNSKKFGELVEGVIKETGKKPSIIAHSMGGLIAHGYIKEHPENINKVVYASVPFQPGVGYFDDANDGSQTGLDSTLMSSEAIFTHPATYLLMPHTGSGAYAGKELMRAETWRDNKFSIFKNGGTADMGKFQQMLDRVAAYHTLLDTPKTLNNKFLFVVAECYQTVQTIDKNGKRGYVPGDGRVSEMSAYPKDILTNKKTESICQDHGAQMNDGKILSDIFDFLNKS